MFQGSWILLFAFYQKKKELLSNLDKSLRDGLVLVTLALNS